MPDGADLRQSGERIERLLEEVRAMASRPAWQRVDELVRLIVELYGTGLARIVDLLDSDDTIEEVRQHLLKDQLITSLLLLHGIHPLDLATRVTRALERVRPYLGSHGGGVEIVDIDEAAGVVKLRLGGSCDGCPSSMVTVKLAVEGAIREQAPEVTRIEVEGVLEETEVPRPLESILAKAHANHDNGNHNGHNGASGKLPVWMPFEQPAPKNPGELLTAEVTGEPIMLCRVGTQLYAYRRRCPSCGSLIEHGDLNGDVLTCASCDERYNVRFAGRSLGGRELHLDPIPLLENEHGVKIALPGASL